MKMILFRSKMRNRNGMYPLELQPSFSGANRWKARGIKQH